MNTSVMQQYNSKYSNDWKKEHCINIYTKKRYNIKCNISITCN